MGGNTSFDPKKIVSNSKIAVIGGGPAGSFFALFLRRYADEKGLSPQITIYEQRDFNALGNKGCKGCAGILSPAFLTNLAELGLQVPGEIVQSQITRYTVHSPYTSISISNPAGKTNIVSIYRGGGPRLSYYENQISFNQWLLGEAQKRNVGVEDRGVDEVYLGKTTAIKVAGEILPCDLVVLASGVNSQPPRIEGLDYRPPSTQSMSQYELFAEPDRNNPLPGNMAHVFLVPKSNIIFGTIVAKGPFINVSVLNKGDSPYPIKEFLKLDIVRRVLPEHYQFSCSCQPRVAVGFARNFFADRFVAVGDAAISRLYKDGIGYSLLTARQAALTAIQTGISKEDFSRRYYPLCRSIRRDNQWGRLLFSINDLTRNSPIFLVAQNRLIGNEQGNIKGPQNFTRAAWGMFTGNSSYRNIASLALNPVSLTRMMGVLTAESIKTLLRRDARPPHKLFVGNQKILILGSGFGGTYVFRHLLHALKRNENVEITMLSDENFFLFSPLLHEVATGKIATRHIAFPIRRLNWKDRFNFVQGRIQKIDLAGRRVSTAHGSYEFDYLVLALGSITDISELSANSQSVFTLKTLNDSMLLRNHIIGIFEQAVVEPDFEKQKQLLTFVVCGAGYTGVQLVTELRDFVYRHLARFYKSIDPSAVKIILVEADSKILAGLPAKLSAYALRQLQAMGIELRLNSRVTAIRDIQMEVNNSEIISTHTLVWVAGVVANPLIAGLEVEKDSIGRACVNQFLEAPAVPGVYAVGDCAHFEDPSTGKAVPPRAHNAVRQARVVAHNVLAELRGWEKRPYRYSNTAEAVSLGASKAVVRFYRFRAYGFPARMIWIAGYLFLVTGSYNRLTILIDWALSIFFGRDTTYLKFSK